MPDFVGYYRVSTRKQGSSGLGLDAQKQAVEAYVASVGGRLVGAFSEVESGGSDERPELDRATAFARQKKAMLVIAKLDRLARKVGFIAKLIDSGLDFVAADMPHANKLTIHIIAAVAEYEREVIADRTRASLARAKARGVRLGNPQASLQSARASEIAKKNADAFALRIFPQIDAVRAHGIRSLARIAVVLNEYGVKTQRGREWTAQGVKNVIGRAEALGSRGETGAKKNDKI